MTTEEKVKIMRAYIEGKPVQCKAVKYDICIWMDDSNPCWDWLNYEYRIKSENKEPTYRPYKSIEEMLDDIKKRIDENYGSMQHPVCSGIWLKMKGHKVEQYIHSIDYDENRILLGACWASMQWAFDMYTYLDGTPFGIQE